MLFTKIIDIGSKYYPKKPFYFEYLLKIKQMVNPQNKALSGVYVAAGADIRTVLFSTNCSRLIFVNDSGYDFSAKELLQKLGPHQGTSEYLKNVLHRGFCNWRLLNTSELAMLAIRDELNQLGIATSDITAADVPGAVRLDFFWKHPLAKAAREYSIYFVQGDITCPSGYSEFLNRELDRGFDIYFQKAAMTIPSQYSNFIHWLDARMNQQGFYITDDMSWRPDEPEPDRYARDPNFKEFRLPLSTVVDMTIPGFERKDFYRRPLWLFRSSDDDLYGHWLNVRQKADSL